MKRSYSLSTTDPEAFRRLIDNSAGLGTFSVCMIEVKEPPQASKPPISQKLPADVHAAVGPFLPNPDGAR